MQYTTRYDEESGICTVTVAGRHKRPDDSVELQRFARKFGDEHGCDRFLIDMTRAEIIGSTMDAYRTGTVPEDTEYKQLTQKIALVYAGDLSDHKFLETVLVNRGYLVRVFDDFTIATEWLTND